MKLTDTSFAAIDFSFLGRLLTIDSVVRDDRDQFAALFAIHSETNVTFFGMEIPP
jgi:hypothetical protein